LPTPRSKKPTSAARPAARSADVPRAWSLALGLATFLAYLALCPPVSGDKDSAEFTLVLALAGAAHPSGYPLFTLLGHAWVVAWHALGASWAYAANAWTALGGAVALVLLHRLGVALLAPVPALGRLARAGLAALPVAFLVFNPIWTYETTLAEVYSWHVAWALGTVLCFVSTVRLASAPEARGLVGRAALWGLLCGIGAAHHLTAVFVVVPLTLALIVVLVARRALTPALVATGIACGCVPLLSYGFILWRASHPAGVGWPWLRPGLDGLVEHVTGRQYANRFGSFTPSPEQSRFLLWYVWPFLFPGLALLAWQTLRARGLAERAIAWGLAGSAVAATAYAFSYGVPDPSSYFLQPLAFGLVALVPLLGALLGSRAAGHRAKAHAWTVAAVAILLWGPWVRVGMGRAGLYVQFDRYVHSMWQAIPFDRAFVFWTNDMHYKLDERQLLDHEKPGIEILNAGVLQGAEPRRRFIEAHGFDPVPPVVEGSDVERAIEERVNALSALPVIHFDPEKGTVRLLKKAAPGDSL